MMNDQDVANIYLESLIEELDAAGYEPSPNRPHGFGITVREYMQQKNCSEPVARKTLDTAKKAGVLEMHMMRTREKAKAEAVYCRPSEWPPMVKG
jgi:hypothetical protein